MTVTEPKQSGGLQVFGLSHVQPASLEYRTLDEALAQSLLEVTEMTEGGSVPTLKLVNKSDGRVFLMAGEQLIGAKQNRVLNTSLMVAAHSEIPIPVSCVEQSRWSYRSRSFGSHGTSSHSKLRKVLCETVTSSYASTSMPTSDQGRVWGEVSRKLGAMGSHSDTMALEQAYTDTKTDLDVFENALTVPEGAMGVVFALHGKIVGLDLFDQAGTLQKLWPKLLRAYAMDAMEPATEAKPVATRECVEVFVKHLRDVEPKQFTSPGLGEDMRIESKELVGAGLVVESSMVHLQAFASEF